MNEKSKFDRKDHDKDSGKNQGKRGNGRGRSRRRNDAPDSSRRADMHHGSNNPAWYAANEALLKDAASLAFSNPLGSVVEPLGANSFYSWKKEAVPGIMAFKTLTIPGVSRDNSSPINVSARAMYSFIRHANSGHSNYDSPDCGLYLLATDSAYTYWAWMVRAYGVLQNYAHSNRYYASDIIGAMGFDYNSLMEHIADFRAYINVFAYKLGSICVPANVAFITRHVWQMTHLWVDSPSRKAQTYMYVPHDFWIYDETGSAKGGRLVPLFGTGGAVGIEFNTVREYGDRMLAKILESEDMMIMSGDILKAYGANIQKVTTIGEDFRILPEYSPEVASQFENLTVLGKPTSDSNVIVQDPDTNAIIYDPKFTLAGSKVYPDKLYLNLHSDFPTPAEVMVATRCAVIMSASGSTGSIKTAGSDIITECHVYKRVVDSNGALQTMRGNWFSFEVIKDTDPAATVLGVIQDIMDAHTFTWRPCMYLYWVAADGSYQPKFIGGDTQYDNYTVISDYELEKMNMTALLSMFGAPTMGAFVSTSK